MQKTDILYVAGHRGLVGSALVRSLQAQGFTRILCRTSQQLDLRDQLAVRQFFAAEKPAYVFLAAAKVGGIYANATYPAEFIHDNLLIQCNVIDSAYRNGVKKLLFLGSSCIYPKCAPQPMPESCLLTSPLEPTNDAYALAKIAGIKMCQAYRTQYGFDAIAAMPTNLYGLGDNYHPENSHVVPALIRRFHEAKQHGDHTVTLWGTGNPRREFLYADDMARACVFLMQKYSHTEHINIGCGQDMSILELAQLIATVVGFTGTIATDPTKPDGTSRKLLDVTKLYDMGWRPSVNLKQGLTMAYKNFLEVE